MSRRRESTPTVGAGKPVFVNGIEISGPDAVGEHGAIDRVGVSDSERRTTVKQTLPQGRRSIPGQKWPPGPELRVGSRVLVHN